MSNSKCSQCGLVNFSTAEFCKRCAAPLKGPEEFADTFEEGGHRRRSLFKRLVWIVGMVFLILFLAYISLIETSDSLSFDQKQVIYAAVKVLEKRGFEEDAFILGHLVTYRASDNWWNKYVGHSDAYAATNFPFEVVTLYTDFFNLPQDDVERAVILLHEARHLRGDDEIEALTAVWQSKSRLGWTKDKYGQTRVWRNVTEFTQKYVPQLFQCGKDAQSDCAE